MRDWKTCRHCGLPLGASVHRGDYKSCPNCSQSDGEEHIFYPYPSEFGKSSKRISSEKPDGDQSWCRRCRPKRQSGLYPDGIRCSELEEE